MDSNHSDWAYETRLPPWDTTVFGVKHRMRMREMPEYYRLDLRLKQASELAKLSQIIDALRRENRNLDVNERNWLIEHLHPWMLMLGKRQDVVNSLPMELTPFWEVIKKPGYLEENKDRLTSLCNELDTTELSESSKIYALELARQFRHELLY